MGLRVGVYGTFDASCMYIDTDDLADTAGYIVALVVATLALLLLGEGNGDDEVYALEESAGL